MLKLAVPFVCIFLSAFLVAQSDQNYYTHSKAGFSFLSPGAGHYDIDEDRFIWSKEGTHLQIFVTAKTVKKLQNACAYVRQLEREYNDNRKNLIPEKERRLSLDELKKMNATDGCRARYDIGEQTTKEAGSRIIEDVLIVTDRQTRRVFEMSTRYARPQEEAQAERLAQIRNSFHLVKGSKSKK